MISDSSMATHRVYVPNLATFEASGVIRGIRGEEAHHAVRVKRVAVGEALELLDGQGRIGRAVVESTDRDRDGWVVHVRIESLRQIPKTLPAIEVWSGVPKGDRVDDLVDALSQAGASAWAPLRCERSVVEPRAGKRERLARRAEEASKQSGRAWLMQMLDGGSVEQALERTPPKILEAPEAAGFVFADASGGTYQARGETHIRILIGPEGGWSDRERTLARERGAQIARFGPHAMRIETAALAACAIVMDAESKLRGV